MREDRGWEPMRIRDGGVREVEEEKVRGGSFKRVWSRRNRGKIHKDTYYFKIKGPEKKKREMRMQGMGGGRFAPPVFPHPPTAS